MSFGRNPHVAKAEAAEQKANDARDDDTRRRAYHEAAHLWDRAAEREKPGKKRDEYQRNAENNRSLAMDERAMDELENDESQPPPSNVIPFKRTL